MNDTADNATGPVGPERLATIFRRHAAALELFARQFCGAAGDVVQEALMELAARAEAPDDDVAWLYGTVRYKAISAARGQRRRWRRETRAAEARSAWFVDLNEQAVDAQIAASTLETLPAAQREVVVAHVWGGLSFEQIGRLTRTSRGTAHRRYRSALSAIRKKLRVSCPEKD